jgi:hypothetical protein
MLHFVQHDKSIGMTKQEENMPFEINREKSYDKPAEAVYAAALKAASGLEGQLSGEKPEAGEFEIRFDKKILGNVLGDRTFMSVKVSENDAMGTTVSVEAYPLDAIGRKLMFGARKGVTQQVVTWFFAHLEHHLG